MRRLLAVGIAAYLTASCATTGPSLYLEPPLPDDETAWFLVRRPQSLWSETAVRKIDDLEVRYTLPFQGSWSRMTWSLKVTPGEHRIDCLYVPFTPFQGHLTLVSFVVDFSKGQSYSIFGRSDDDKVQIWVENAETGEVAGMGTVVLGED